MKGTMLAVAPLCLLFCWILPIGSDANNPSPTIPLGMVEDAVDDMYDGCNKEMEKMVSEKYFKEENRPNSIFGKAWKEAEHCASNTLKNRDIEDQALTKNHMLAICAYTAKVPDIYVEFNKAVRTNRKNYGTSSFPYHSLHFWLTSAVQILNNNQQCYNTYRKNNVAFTGSVGDTIRFGTFASSSLLKNLTKFGDKTCFEIKTCLGGYLKHYSSLGIKQREVLIPPYETFKITKIIEKQKDPKCDTVYVLDNVSKQSNLNCSIANKQN